MLVSLSEECTSQSGTYLIISDNPSNNCRYKRIRGERWSRPHTWLSKLLNRKLHTWGGAQGGDHDGPVVLVAFVDIGLGMMPTQMIAEVCD